MTDPPRERQTRRGRTCFAGRDSQEVAGAAPAHTVGSEHTDVVGPGRVQIHHSQLIQAGSGVGHLGPLRRVPGHCKRRRRRSVSRLPSQLAL